MKRLAITGKERIEVIDYTEREIEEDELLVRTEMASGKHGTVSALLSGPNFDGVRFDTETRLFLSDKDQSSFSPSREEPYGVGTTGVGVVESTGSRVRNVSVGQRVFGIMDVKETNILKEEQVWTLEDMSTYNALCIEPAYVAFHTLRESRFGFGDKVLVVGLGAIGLIAVAMARAGGAEQVIAVDIHKKRRDLAEKLGADYIVDPSHGDPADLVHNVTGGPGVDVALEAGGTYKALDTAIRSTRVGGTVCTAGFYQGEANSVWLGREWHHNRLTMIAPHGCGWGHPPRDYPRWTRERAYDAIVSIMRKGIIDISEIIDPVISIEEAPALFERMRTDSSTMIKYAVSFK